MTIVVWLNIKAKIALLGHVNFDDKFIYKILYRRITIVCFLWADNTSPLEIARINPRLRRNTQVYIYVCIVCIFI